MKTKNKQVVKICCCLIIEFITVTIKFNLENILCLQCLILQFNNRRTIYCLQVVFTYINKKYCSMRGIYSTYPEYNSPF